MNKRYMDFVPKNKNVPVKKPVEVRKPVPVAEEPEVYTETLVEETVSFEPENPRREAVAPVESRPVDLEEDIDLEEFFSVDNRGGRRRNEPDFGVIEDYKPKFVKTEVTKRPLGRPEVKPVEHAAAKPVNEAALAKSQKVGAKPFMRKPVPATKPTPGKVASSEKVVSVPEKETLKVPKTKFVNTEKVEKRPLSKNVYKKKIVAPKEEPTGPVTIITKPDKGSHIGVIVTIVLTIILGAAAGTVAFLLLPK